MSDETLPKTPPPAKPAEMPPFEAHFSSSGDIAPDPLQETLLPGLPPPLPVPADADPGVTMDRAPVDTNPAPGEAAIGETLEIAVAPKSSEEALAAQSTMNKPGAVTATRTSFPQIGGHEIVRELGRGGMGVVYLARHKRLKRLVALKMVLAGAQADPEQMERFQLEAEAIARLQHPNIVQVYEIGNHENLPYFSLEFLDGGSLDRRLKKGPLDDRLAARLLEVLARGMAAAHQAGVIHRDLKPANVLLGGSEETPLEQCVLKITDFGLAKKLDEDSGQTRAGTIVGTPSYMPPEQAWGKVDELGPLVDVYSLGAILYELLTGRPPFRAASVWDTLDQVVKLDPVPPRQLQPTVSRDLETICLKCLRKAPAERYASAADLVEDLRRFQAGEPIVARPVGRVERLRKWVRRHPAQAAAWASGAVASLALFVVLLLYADKAQKELAAVNWRKSESDDIQRFFAECQRSYKEALDKPTDPERLRKANEDVSRLIARIGNDPEWDNFRVEAKALEADVKDGPAARSHFEDMIRYKSEALFSATQSSEMAELDQVRIARDAARKALLAIGETVDAPEAVLLAGKYLTDLEKQEVALSRYEMLVVLADVIGRPLPGEDARKQTAEALSTLDKTKRLGEPTQTYYLRRAGFLDQQGDKAAAEEARKLAKITAPHRAVDFFLLGEQAYRKNDWLAATRFFDRALRLEPDYFWAHYYLAVCKLQTRDFAGARAQLDICVSRQRDFIPPRVLRGYVLGELGRLALDDSRLNAEERRNQAEDWFAAGADDFKTALDLKPSKDERYNLLVNRGVLYVHQKHYSDAEKDLRQAIHLKPDRIFAYVNLALALQQQHQWPAAIEQLDAAVKLRPTLSLLYRHRARVQSERSTTDDPSVKASAVRDALRDLDTAIKLEEKRGVDNLPYAEKLALADDHYQRARLFYQEKRGEDALRECQKATELAPADVRVLRLKAAALLELKRYPEAVAAFDEYLARGKRTAEDYGTRGLARLGNRDKFGAIADLSMALDLEPEGAPVGRWHAERGWAYLLAGDAPKLALDDFDKTLELNPADADAYAGRGNARVKLGDYEKAVLDAAQAVRRAPEDVRILFTAARIYAQAVARAEDDTKRRDHHEMAVRYEVRALDLLDQALDRTRPNERAKFWSESVLRDPAFTPLRRSPRFDQLSRAYPAATK